jgi:ribonuclease T1
LFWENFVPFFIAPAVRHALEKWFQRGAVVVVAAFFLGGVGVSARPFSSTGAFEPALEGAADLVVMAQSALPEEAQNTLKLIGQGGPFPYTKDGVVFGNRERILPRRARGYYHEYTVPTPSVRHRGARRVVCGGKLVTQPEVCFYTADHYTTFSRIVP